MLQCRRWILLLVVGGFTSWMPAAVAAGNQDPSTSRIVRSILQADEPLAARDKALQVLVKRANEGSAFAQFTLGSLYQWGQRNPDSPVHRNLAKASLYLSNAATHGAYVPSAMTALAEINLLESKPLPATIWAQMYAYYTRSKDGRINGYAAELLNRCFQVLPKGSMPKVRNDVRNLENLYGKTIRAGVQLSKGLHGAEGLHFRSVNEHLKMGRPIIPTELPAAGIALYLVAFGPDGRVRKTWQINAMPRWRLGQRLQRYVNNFVVEGGKPNADGLRYATIPMVFDDGRFVARGSVSQSPH